MLRTQLGLTLVHGAALQGHFRVLRDLQRIGLLHNNRTGSVCDKDQGSPLEGKGEFGYHRLRHWLESSEVAKLNERGDTEIAEYIRGSSKIPTHCPAIPLADTPLHLVVHLTSKRGSQRQISAFACMALLIRSGGDLTAVNDLGYTPLQHASDELKEMLEDVKHDSMACLRRMVERLPPHLARVCAWHGRGHDVIRFRRAHEAQRDARMVHGAAREGRPLELGKRLRVGRWAGGAWMLGQRGSPGAGLSPLACAVQQGHVQCASVLLGAWRRGHGRVVFGSPAEVGSALSGRRGWDGMMDGVFDAMRSGLQAGVCGDRDPAEGEEDVDLMAQALVEGRAWWGGGRSGEDVGQVGGQGSGGDGGKAGGSTVEQLRDRVRDLERELAAAREQLAAAEAGSL